MSTRNSDTPAITKEEIRRRLLTAVASADDADPLVDDVEEVDVLTVLAARAVELFSVRAAGILLVNEVGQLRPMGATDRQIQLLELVQIQNDEGPSLDCFRTGMAVVQERLDRPLRWPRFADESIRAGFGSFCAVPLRADDRVLGCLELFIAEPGALGTTDLAVAQALADVASIAVMQDHVARRAEIRAGHLQHALTSRIAIEQAKGMIAAHACVDMDQAFSRLRNHARRNNLGLTRVAQGIVDASISIDSVAGPRADVPAPPPNPQLRAPCRRS